MNDKEKSITDMLALRAAKIEESRAVVKKAQAEEQRKLTKTEEAILTRNELEVRAITLDIAEKEIENRTAKIDQARGDAAPIKKVSLRSMINEALRGEFSDESKAIMAEGRKLLQEAGIGGNKEARGMSMAIPFETRTAQTVGTAANGGNTVETERQGLLLPLMDDIILDKLGITKASGLVGDIMFPAVSAVTAGWAGETTAATETNATFSNAITFKPKRLTAKITISNQLLIQSSEDVEMILRKMIVEAIQQTLQSTLFGTGAATTTKPAGLFATLPTDKGAITWDRVIALRTKLATKNALRGNPKFLINPLLDGKCRTTLKSSVAGATYLLGDDNKMAGFDVVETNAVPTGLQTGADESALAFGNFGDYFLGSWGALSLTVDPYTKSDENSVVLVINSFWDGGLLRKDSIVTATAK